MINGLALLSRNGACLKLLAIDAGNDIDMMRDEYMVFQLSKAVNNEAILVLLGGLHSLKKVNWNHSKGKPFVAEILNSHGYDVKSYPQVEASTKCSESLHYRFVSANTPEALELLNKSLISLLNAYEPISALGVIDGFISWECSE